MISTQNLLSFVVLANGSYVKLIEENFAMSLLFIAVKTVVIFLSRLYK